MRSAERNEKQCTEKNRQRKERNEEALRKRKEGKQRENNGERERGDFALMNRAAPLNTSTIDEIDSKKRKKIEGNRTESEKEEDQYELLSFRLPLPELVGPIAPKSLLINGGLFFLVGLREGERDPPDEEEPVCYEN